jgi:hypothetical protein
LEKFLFGKSSVTPKQKRSKLVKDETDSEDDGYGEKKKRRPAWEDEEDEKIKWVYKLPSILSSKFEITLP